MTKQQLLDVLASTRSSVGLVFDWRVTEIGRIRATIRVNEPRREFPGRSPLEAALAATAHDLLTRIGHWTDEAVTRRLGLDPEAARLVEIGSSYPPDLLNDGELKARRAVLKTLMLKERGPLSPGIQVVFVSSLNGG